MHRGVTARAGCSTKCFNRRLTSFTIATTAATLCARGSMGFQAPAPHSGPASSDPNSSSSSMSQQQVAFAAPAPAPGALHSSSSTSRSPQLARKLLLVSDLDDTMVGTDPQSDYHTTAFRDFWHQAKASGVPCSLVYNTGRSFPMYEALWSHKSHCMAAPDVIIGGVGTRIYTSTSTNGGSGGGSNQQGCCCWQEDSRWTQHLDEDWNLAGAEAVVAAAIQEFGEHNVRLADSFENSPHKLTMLYKAALRQDMLALIQQQLRHHGFQATVIEGGSAQVWRFIDLIPKNAGKGRAMSYVQQLLGFDEFSTVAAGDSPNDLLMLAQAKLGIVVSNCTPDVRSWALAKVASLQQQEQQQEREPGGWQQEVLFMSQRPRAAGIMEGLAALGFIHQAL